MWVAPAQDHIGWFNSNIARYCGKHQLREMEINLNNLHFQFEQRRLPGAVNKGTLI